MKTTAPLLRDRRRLNYYLIPVDVVGGLTAIQLAAYGDYPRRRT